ncbi:phosphocholine cytidylyltransferase family protein [Campylobacter molothri]|uniref:phosphocholine cytidylyltransferase family protein n=1 Tax=Campylobacter molothri TaxID=1032242 RepID=UPI00301D27A1|nr:phosphocholine cytidylyltransferase family protein [Campylobacter sp. RM17709]
MRAIILAAGFGSRLMPLTQNNPKCMVKYKNQELISYEIQALKGAGIDEIAIVGGYLFDILKNFIQERFGLNHFYINENYSSTNMLYTLFCAREFLQTCIKDKQDLIVSYADIVYFKDTIELLKKAKDPLAIVIDEDWKKLWQRRFENPLEDAETLKIDKNNFIIELGKKAQNYDQIQGQYIGLFKISSNFLSSFIDFYDHLDRNALYDGKDFNNMYMTSFLQALIDHFHNAKVVRIQGNWCEIDFKSDLEIQI